MPFILLSIAIIEANLRHALGISAPLLEVGILCYLIRYFFENKKQVLGAHTFYIVGFCFLFFIYFSILYYGKIQSTGYVTLPLKIMIIPFVVFYFKSNTNKSFEINISIFVLATSFFLIDGNPLGVIHGLNKNEFCHYLLCFFGLISLSFLNNDKKINQKMIIIQFILIVALVASTLLSRQFLVSIICGLLFLNMRFQISGIRNIALLLFTAYFSLKFLADELLSGYGQKRMNFLLLSYDMTRADSHRFNNLVWGFEEFFKSPYVGYGLGSFLKNSPNGLAAHNSYLSISYELGLLGVSAFVLVLLTNMIALSKLKRVKKDFAHSCIVVFIFALLVQAGFQDILAKYSILIILAVPLIVLDHSRTKIP